jgi:nitroreductase
MQSDSVLPARLATLIAAAVRAPSADNTQPWRFTIDPQAGLIGLDIDARRDASPLNPGQRMARIAVGAALENILSTANGNGWQAETLANPRPFLALVRVADPFGPDGAIDPAVEERVSNRHIYDGQPVPAAVLGRLRRLASVHDGIRTCWLTEAERLAALIGQCDAALFGQAAMWRAFLSRVRFDAGAGTVTEGLPLDSLELSFGQRLALRYVGRGPQWLLKYGGGLRSLAAHTRRLVASSSGLCVILAPDDRPQTDVLVGRAAQRAWLALTAEGLAAQPMMSLPGLEAALRYGVLSQPDSLGEHVAGWRRSFAALAPDVCAGRVAFVLRFGHAPAPSARAGRRELAAALRIAALQDGAVGAPVPV